MLALEKYFFKNFQKRTNIFQFFFYLKGIFRIFENDGVQIISDGVLEVFALEFYGSLDAEVMPTT